MGKEIQKTDSQPEQPTGQNEQPMLTASETTEAVATVAKGIIAAEVTSQIDAVVDTVKSDLLQETTIQIGEANQTMADQVEAKVVAEVAAQVEAKVTTEVTAQVEAKMAEVTAQVGQAETEAKNNNHSNLIKLVKSQSRSFNAVMFLIILGMTIYIVFDKIQENHPTVIPITPLETVMTDQPLLGPIFGQEDLVIPETYQAIVKKQLDILEQKPIGDTRIRSIIGETITNSEKVSTAIQANIDSLKRAGLLDGKAMAKAFISEEVVTAVLGELPEEIKTLPQAKEFVQKELARIASYVELKFKEK